MVPATTTRRRRTTLSSPWSVGCEKIHARSLFAVFGLYIGVKFDQLKPVQRAQTHPRWLWAAHGDELPGPISSSQVWFLHKSFIIIGTLWIWLLDSQTSSSPAEENCQGEFDRGRSRWKKIDKKDWAIGNLCISGKVQIVVLASQAHSKGLKEERLRLEDLNWYFVPHNVLK